MPFNPGSNPSGSRTLNAEEIAWRDRLQVRDLKEFLRSYGQPRSGNKPALRNRVTSFLQTSTTPYKNAAAAAAAGGAATPASALAATPAATASAPAAAYGGYNSGYGGYAGAGGSVSLPGSLAALIGDAQLAQLLGSGGGGMGGGGGYGFGGGVAAQYSALQQQQQQQQLQVQQQHPPSKPTDVWEYRANSREPPIWMPFDTRTSKAIHTASVAKAGHRINTQYYGL